MRKKLVITFSIILPLVLLLCWYHRVPHVEWEQSGPYTKDGSIFYYASYTCSDGSLRNASVTENPSEMNYHGALTNPSGMRGGAICFRNVESAKKYAAKRLVESCDSFF